MQGLPVNDDATLKYAETALVRGRGGGGVDYYFSYEKTPLQGTRKHRVV